MSRDTTAHSSIQNNLGATAHTTLDTGRCSHSTCSLVVLVALTSTVYRPFPMAVSRSLLTRVTLLSLRYSFTFLASSAGLEVALARDLVPACIQNSEHVGWLHALSEAISYLCRCRYPVNTVSTFRVDLCRTPTIAIEYRLSYSVELYL